MMQNLSTLPGAPGTITIGLEGTDDGIFPIGRHSDVSVW